MVKSNDEPNTVAVNKDPNQGERKIETRVRCIDREMQVLPADVLGTKECRKVIWCIRSGPS